MREELSHELGRRLLLTGEPARRCGHGAVPIQQHGRAYVGRELVEIAKGELGGKRGVGHVGQNSGVPLPRLAWLLTVIACLIAAFLLLLNDYVGYFGVLLAVGAAAAVNLR